MPLCQINESHFRFPSHIFISSIFPENCMQVNKQTRKSWLSQASTCKSKVQLKHRKGQRLGKLESKLIPKLPRHFKSWYWTHSLRRTFQSACVSCDSTQGTAPGWTCQNCVEMTYTTGKIKSMTRGKMGGVSQYYLQQIARESEVIFCIWFSLLVSWWFPVQS